MDARQLWRPFWAMVLAAPLASWLRAVWLNAPILWLFVLVLGGFSALGILAWRALYSLFIVRRLAVPGSPMDEVALIQDARRGDLEAFNRLVLAYQDMVYSQAYRMMGESESSRRRRTGRFHIGLPQAGYVSRRLVQSLAVAHCDQPVL